MSEEIVKAKVALLSDVFMYSMTDRKTGDMIVNKSATTYKETKRGRVGEIGGNGKIGLKKREAQAYVKKLIDRKGKDMGDGYVAIDGLRNDLTVAIFDDMVRLIVGLVDEYIKGHQDKEKLVSGEIIHFIQGLKGGKIKDLGNISSVLDKDTIDADDRESGYVRHDFQAQVIREIENAWNDIGSKKPEINLKQLGNKIEKKIKKVQ